MEKNLLDFLLQQGAAGQRTDPPESAWNSIAAALHKRRKRRIFCLFIFATLILTGTTFFLYNKNKAGSFTQNNIENQADPVKQFVTKHFSTIHTDASTLPATNIIQNQTEGFTLVDDRKKGYTTNLYPDKKQQHNLQSKKTSIYEGKEKTIPVYNAEPAIAVDELLEKEVIDEIQDNNSGIAASYESPVLKQEKEKNLEKPDTVTAENNTRKKESIPEVKTPVETGKQDLPIKIKVKNTWKPAIAVSYHKLYMNLTDQFDFGQSKSINYGNSFLNAAITDSYYQANYLNGFGLDAAGLWVKSGKNKKKQFQLGVSLRYGQFHANVYSASRVKVFERNNLILIDSGSVYNSTYAARPTSLLGFDQVSVKNNFLQLGFVAGMEKDLLQIKNNQKIKLQVQLVSGINLSQSFLWYDNSSGRYFTDKNLNRKLFMHPFVSLLYEWNYKGKRFALGPDFNYAVLNQNKAVTNLNKIHTSGLGIRFQMGLKK